MQILRSLCLTVCWLAAASTAQAAEIRLAAAASLKDVVSELSYSYNRQHADVRFVRYFGASGTLAKQIDNGADADIFISANRKWLDYLRERKLIDSDRIATFTGNTLVFVGRGEKPIADIGELTALARIAIGSPRSVPAGEYAMSALTKAGIAGQLAKRLVIAKDVREALLYAERGEVDGAFVYLTDALQAKQVKVLFIVPQELYPRVTYPMGITADGAGNRDAADFFRFLQSAEAQSVLVRYGFVIR
ncbi:MAG: molybdate ABC transporter substrate-binding protein [Geobacteraceae bacterium]